MVTTLRRHHDTFRAMLQINLTVLATAHAVSEGIVRGVNTEIQRRNIPNTYTASGQRAAPGPRNLIGGPSSRGFQALRSVARRRCGASLVRSSVWK